MVDDVLKSQERDIKLQIGKFAQAFLGGDGAGMLGLWVPEPAAISYQPEELGAPLLSHREVKSYIDRMPEIVDSHRDVRSIDFSIAIEDGVAVVYSRFWARLVFKHLDAPIDGQIRQSFVLKQRDGEWLFAHYHESRQVPGFEAFEK